MKLTILIASVHTRRNTFLPKIMESVYSQYESLTPSEQEQVEVLVLADNKKTQLGDKRNKMLEMAQGEYVVFVDDDDRIAHDYIRSILEASESGADAITFLAEVSLNGEAPKTCRYSIAYNADHNTPEGYFRLPNHICAVKREIAMIARFPSLTVGEDAEYARRLKNLLMTETAIEKTLYYYDYNSETTETQGAKKPEKRYNERENDTFLDLVILSNAKDEQYMKMTETAIQTALDNAQGYKINVIVMEQNRQVSYLGAKTVHYDEQFNYNRLANNGVRLGNAPYVMVANNDLIFHKDWLKNLVLSNASVCSPKCPVDRRQRDLRENETGLELIRNFSGWCFMMKRSVWELIGGFDEDFSFWFADNAVLMQLKDKYLKSTLVVDSLVEHLGSKTLDSLPPRERHAITYAKEQGFADKYDKGRVIRTFHESNRLGNNRYGRKR